MQARHRSNCYALRYVRPGQVLQAREPAAELADSKGVGLEFQATNKTSTQAVSDVNAHTLTCTRGETIMILGNSCLFYRLYQVCINQRVQHVVL